MQVVLQIVAFSLQIIGSGRSVVTKGKRPKRMESGNENEGNVRE